MKVLKEVKEIATFIEQLEKLPLKSFSIFLPEEKAYIANALINQQDFTTLHELEYEVNRIYTAYQQKDRIILEDGTQSAGILFADEVEKLVGMGTIVK